MSSLERRWTGIALAALLAGGALPIAAVAQAHFPLPPTPPHTTSLSSCAIYTWELCEPCEALSAPASPFFIHGLRLTDAVSHCLEGQSFSFPVAPDPGEAISWNFRFSPPGPGSYSSSSTLEFMDPDFPGQEEVEIVVTGQTSHGICFYESSDGLFGHGFVQLIPNDGASAGANDLRWGKYPRWYSSSAPGKIADDSATGWGWRICYPLSPADFLSVSSYIAQQGLAPSDYSLKNANCIHWLVDVAAEAGVDLPSVVDGFDYTSPLGLKRSLEAIGHLGRFGTGFVERNDDPRDGRGAGPVDWNAGVLASLVHDEPASVAAALGYGQPNVVDLGTFSTSREDGIQVGITNADPAAEDVLATVRWHTDQAVPEIVEGPTLFHAYSGAGTYRPSLAVIDRGSVNLYRWTVLVSGSSLGPWSAGVPPVVAIDVPPTVPNETPNPGLADPPPVPVIESLFIDGFESGDASRWDRVIGEL